MTGIYGNWNDRHAALLRKTDNAMMRLIHGAARPVNRQDDSVVWTPQDFQHFQKRLDTAAAGRAANDTHVKKMDER